MTELKDIYKEINDEVVNDLTIGATSTSKVAEYRLIMYVVTSISSILQGFWDLFRIELQEAADAVPTCNEAWWDREIRKFQYGHPLLLDGLSKKYYYEEVDEDAQIINRVAIYNQSGKGLIKVAKDGPVALSVDEKAALNSYIKKIQPLGSNIVMISQAADVIRLGLTVHFDPIIPQATVKTNVEAAINTYLSSLQFNVGRTGTFYITYLIDAIQLVEGVVDVVPVTIEACQAGGVLTTIDRKYVPVAGYISIHPDYALDDTITYVAEV